MQDVSFWSVRNVSVIEVKVLYLKKIKIHGFKSFADDVKLDFESGITAVVGPNGSGKSNIGDAIRWVLGEQSVKTLRGSKMQDVIFSGTQNRKALNFAEVSLILDNTNKSLPVDYSEVNITRRIYRSGESEYYINKGACRLKDIRQLFMDTGVGRDGYSIIGQGKIDEILSSKSEDRRNIFEEAAGIMKYKSRKIESERKLESTKQNVLRINDIISELELQLQPLKEQSLKANKYLELSEKLKVLDINLFIENYNKLKDKLEFSKKDLIDIEKMYDECTKKLENSDKSYNEFVEQNKDMENSIANLNQEIFEFEKQFEKINSDINIANEKIANSKSNAQRIQNESTLLEQKKNSLESDLNNKNEKMTELSNIVDEANKLVFEKQSEISKINESLNESINQIEDLKSEIIERHNEISTKKGTINSINVLLDNVNKRKEQVNVEIEQLNLEKNEKNNQKLNLSNLINDNRKKFDEISKRLIKNNDLKKEIEKEFSNNSDEINKTNEILHKKTSRHTLLKDMDKEYQGFTKSVKSILKECDKSPKLSKGIHGALAQLISVPKKYETALEVALGATLQNIVSDDEKSAQKIIEFLKVNKLGRATFLPLSSISARDFNGLENKLAKEKGFVGIACNLLEFDKKYDGIIRNLLGKVLIVDNIDNGVYIARKYKYAFKIVTLEGEVLFPGGSMSGGSTNKTTSILSRSREIEELASEIKNLKKYLEDIINKNNKLTKKIKDIDIKIEQDNSLKREIELLLVTKESEFNQCNDNIARLDERVNILKLENVQLEDQSNDANNQLIQINEEIQNISKQIEEMTNKTSLNQENYNNQVEIRDKFADELTQYQIRISGVNRDIIAVKENIDRINKDITETKTQIDNYKALTISFENEIAEQNNVITAKMKEIEDLKLLKEQKTNELSKKINEKSDLQLRTEQIQKSWKQYNNELNEIAEKRNKFELKNTKYEIELETLVNRIWEDYEMTYSKCLEYRQDISEFGNPNKALKEIKSQINSLGNVNVDAIEEYQRVKERHEFLTKQREDLEEAEKSLRKVINDMVKIMKEQFVEQFEIINNNFNAVFKELFGGGRAYLKLMDEENILECGIEIEAQPPGKKLQNLSLLSGGERALTGIAILFAILKVRPTPFCVLDEIEAALDDVNVYRFAEYLKRFTQDTQFLIITHRKGTMEAADTIYGVTMQEHGVSKMVSIKLDDIAS